LLHIRTSNAAVIAYLSAQSSVRPAAPSTFTRAADDTSVLSQNPARWGGEFYPGLWGDANPTPITDRLWRAALYIHKANHWLISAGRVECDDWIDGGGYSANGTWRIYVR
jgi:hypothetical protein